MKFLARQRAVERMHAPPLRGAVMWPSKVTRVACILASLERPQRAPDAARLGTSMHEICALSASLRRSQPLHVDAVLRLGRRSRLCADENSGIEWEAAAGAVEDP